MPVIAVIMVRGGSDNNAEQGVITAVTAIMIKFFDNLAESMN